MEPTAITPKLLLPQAQRVAGEVLELTEEEAALRHKLELRAERALYRAAMVFQSRQGESSAHNYVDCGWSSKQKLDRAMSDAEAALQELRARRLYRSTHHNFNQYLRDRFGQSVVEVLPGRS